MTDFPEYEIKPMELAEIDGFLKFLKPFFEEQDVFPLYSLCWSNLPQPARVYVMPLVVRVIHEDSPDFVIELNRDFWRAATEEERQSLCWNIVGRCTFDRNNNIYPRVHYPKFKKRSK